MSNPQVLDGAGPLVQGTTGIGDWALDPSASRLQFTAKTLWGVVPVHGHFAELEGTAHVRADGQVTASLAVDAFSVDTKLKRRDGHLRSAHFLDASAHRYMTVQISRVSFASKGTATASGELTVAGRTQPVTFDARATASADAQEVVVEARLDVDHGRLGMSPGLLGMVRPTTRVDAQLVFRYTLPTAADA